ncbi:putative transcription factor MYB family [Helianthus annuus]|uniref:Putative MADF domain, Myb-like domain protein n=1 Tax=Helianthus annuus TaxID=4232 RepID=A0A251TBX1_HELAN|nr:trihelix transcription factor ASIL1 [Helianthus annuus]KAF5783217.1 putative transcription factor MYB family [Helianthus annuus]
MTTSWSNDETVALINTYRDKWYSLRRSKLRATDWQEVADAVVGHCTGNPPKTSVQCQHKMEKLRKRYRAELQNVGDFNYSKSLHKYSSSWIYFKLMYCLESGDYCSDPSVNRVNRNKQDIPLYDLHCNGIKHGVTLPLNKRYHGGSTGSRISHKKVSSLDNDFSPPTGGKYGPRKNRSGQNGLGGVYSEKVSSLDDFPSPIGGKYESGGVYSGGGKRKDEGEGVEGSDGGDVMDEMTCAIERLGDGFEKMERVKMDMTRELESLRMKMERKRAEMVIETQRKVWDLSVEMVMEKEKKNKKIKGMGIPGL